LVVRQPELVGRTVPCPKCKNAIHVVRPGEVAWNPGVVGTADAPAGTDAKRKPGPPPTTRRPVSTVNSEAITKADPGDWNLEDLETALAAQSPTTNEDGQEVFFREVTSEPVAARRKESEPFAIQPLDPAANPCDLAKPSGKSSSATFDIVHRWAIRLLARRISIHRISEFLR
jgi:hypothetical protein